MYYVYGFVIKAMMICSSQMGVLDFGPALAYYVCRINLGFLTQNEICSADVLILGQTFTSGHSFHFLSYPSIYLET